MKIIATLMALLMALTTLTAFAGDDFIPSPEADLMTGATLSGYVLEVNDEYLLVKTPDGLYVEALLTGETLFEGADVQVGDVIKVGQLVAIAAEGISANIHSSVNGVVTAVNNGSIFIDRR